MLPCIYTKCTDVGSNSDVWNQSKTNSVFDAMQYMCNLYLLHQTSAVDMIKAQT